MSPLDRRAARAALSHYEERLEAGLGHERTAGRRREERSYDRHLKEAGRLRGLLDAGAPDGELRDWARAERRTHGWGFLPHDPGAAATTAFVSLARLLDPTGRARLSAWRDAAVRRLAEIRASLRRPPSP